MLSLLLRQRKEMKQPINKYDKLLRMQHLCTIKSPLRLTRLSVIDIDDHLDYLDWLNLHRNDETIPEENKSCLKRFVDGFQWN